MRNKNKEAYTILGAMIVAATIGAIVTVSALAGMEAVTKSFTLVGTNFGTATFTVRGTVEAVYVDLTAGGVPTGTVTVTSAGRYVYRGADLTADALVYPNIIATDTNGTALTYSVTPGVTNVVYQKVPVAGDVTVKVDAAKTVATISTNTWAVTLIYNK